MSKTTYEAKVPTIDDFCDPEPVEQKEMFPGFPCFLFTSEDLKKAKSRDDLPCKCARCGKSFPVQKHEIQRKIKHSKSKCFCSNSCHISWKNTGGKAPEERKSYVCENCGRTVSVEEYYGSGRFCSEFCSHSYVAKMTHTEEFKKRVSAKLKTHIKAKKQKKIQEPTKISYKDHFLEPSELMHLLSKWNIKDAAALLQIPKSRVLLFANQNSIAIPNNYVNSNAYALINACRHFLNKSFEDGSITLSDLSQVQNSCIRLLRSGQCTTKELCTIHLGMKRANPSFITHCLHISLPSLSDGVKTSYYKKHPRDKSDYEKYRAEASFKFSSVLYPYVKNAELLKQYKWLSKENPKDDGITRDHRVSIQYGYEHNIDPYLISHPANCEFMLRNDNSSKQDKCSITVEQLIEEVEWWNENIIHKIFNDFQKETPEYRKNIVKA